MENALKRDPFYAIAYTMKGKLLNKMGLIQEAIECCRIAIKLDFKDLAAYVNQGSAFVFPPKT